MPYVANGYFIAQHNHDYTQSYWPPKQYTDTYGKKLNELNF